MLKNASALSRGRGQRIRTSVAPDCGLDGAARLSGQLDLDRRPRQGGFNGAPDVAEVGTLLRREHPGDGGRTIHGEGAGAYDDRHLAATPLHLAEESHSIEVRHAEVEDDDVGPHTIEGGQGVESVDRLEDFEVALEAHPVQCPPSRIIVDEEHLCHGGSTSWRLAIASRRPRQEVRLCGYLEGCSHLVASKAAMIRMTPSTREHSFSPGAGGCRGGASSSTGWDGGGRGAPPPPACSSPSSRARA